MTPNRGLTIFFNDGTSMSFEFPPQGDSAGSSASRIAELLKHQMLMLEVEGSLLSIPLNSIKYLQVWPAPEHLPAGVIKAASFTPVV